MRQLDGIHKATGTLGAVMVLAGAVMIINPKRMVMVHRGSDGPRARNPVSTPEILSPHRSQFYGTLAVLMGTSICWLVFRSRRE